MINKEKHRLFGYELKIDHHATLYYGTEPSLYTFYLPIQSLKSRIWIHVWSVNYLGFNSYFFSAFHNGNHIIPDHDCRFTNAISKWFPKYQPWTECSFNGVSQLIEFLQKCEI